MIATRGRRLLFVSNALRQDHAVGRALARRTGLRVMHEVDDYVDTALANFEQFLTRALSSIERGRDKMHALREIGTFQGEENERPLPF